MALATLIMAAGKGTRMKSDLAKVLHEINNKPMLHYVIEQAQALNSAPIIIIIGHQRDTVIAECKKFNVGFAVQAEQLGTGHAVMQAEDLLKNFSGNVLILSGDVPLLTAKTLFDLEKVHSSNNATASVLTAILKDPTGYGRVVRDNNGQISAIVEHKDASDEIKKITEINTGIYIVDAKKLFNALKEIKNENSQKEYYLPDILPIFIKQGNKVLAHSTPNFDETRGVNTVEQLQECEQILNDRIAQ
jgi:UDP-N-acetylglucosamine pyrophosphorylase